jgi:cold-inducible RNA-binding protein
MAKKLYVGNLAWATTSDSLKDAFSSAGEVISATVMTEKTTGRSRGFGFVEVSDETADAVINAFNGKDLDGRAIVVNEARPMTDRPPRRDFDRGGDRGGDRGPRRSY